MSVYGIDCLVSFQGWHFALVQALIVTIFQNLLTDVPHFFSYGEQISCLLKTV